jgi:tetratricopeptide (TPR) repeat protein
MGIKYEDGGELVRALKMYTIAYRIRRDNLSRNHPSLVVLLNMLGSIQIKRGELQEAMQIYELALKDSIIFTVNEDGEDQKPTSNLLAKSVTYREMGVIYERWGKIDEALNIYHKSLECVLEWKEAVRSDMRSAEKDATTSSAVTPEYTIADVRLTKAVSDRNALDEEDGEMEAWIGSKKGSSFGVSKNKENVYESFFPAHLEAELETNKGKSAATKSNGQKRTRQDAHADMDLALTLHQIAQLHRCQGEYARALDAFEVALRGMKYALGKHHPNVAAVLGNIGNLQKEMGDMDAAYSTYQEVLGIESYRLGLSHPDVAITLHNIATIDAARGNYDHALQLYRKVIGLEKKLFGDEHISVAVAAACMGDVYEKIGEFSNAMESYEEAVRIKSVCLGRHSVDVARLLHKLGKLAFFSKDFHMAQSFLSRAVLMYHLNKIEEEHPWMVDANRDTADIDAALAMGDDRQFEC